MRKRSARKGFTLIELMVSMAIGSMLMLGMGMVMVTLFVGMRQSRDFFDATERVDLIRQLSFDARTGNAITFPLANGSGAYSNPPNNGHMVSFDSLRYDPILDTTTTVNIVWESVRPIATPTDPMTVNRFVDGTFTFGQGNITNFTVNRTSNRNFTVVTSTVEGDENVEVQLAVTLRNVVD